ncbi:MAG TPA: AtpZ/AtpI family protein [Pedobacter sp.]|jgi:F0F1-type ATP synthase assembly protein I
MEEDKESEFEESIDKGKKSLTGYAKYTGVAFQMMATICLSAFIGFKIDQYFHHEVQWATALCSVIGVCLSIYQTIRQLKN